LSGGFGVALLDAPKASSPSAFLDADRQVSTGRTSSAASTA